MNRIGSLAQQSHLLNLIKGVQSRLYDTQVQAATGQKSQTYSGIASDAARLVSLEDTRVKLERYLDNIALAEQRVSLTDFSLDAMEDSIADIRESLTATPTNFTQLADFARDYLKNFADLMNQKDATRTLFGGTNTAGPAVELYEPGDADPAAPFGGVAGGNSYRYKILATGTPADVAMKVSDNTDVTYAVNANNPATNAFTRILDGLVAVADFGTAANPTPTEAQVQTAIANLTLGLKGDATNDGLEDLRAKVASARVSLNSVKQSHQQLKLYAENAIGDIEHVNTAEVAVRLNADKLQLETSYAALATVSRLSLLDFL